MDPTADEDLTLLQLAQPCANMFSATVWMWDNGATHGGKRWSCSSKTADYKAVMEMSPFGENSDTRCLGVSASRRKMGSATQTNGRSGID